MTESYFGMIPTICPLDGVERGVSKDEENATSTLKRR